jgi:hypothetical protein
MAEYPKDSVEYLIMDDACHGFILERNACESKLRFLSSKKTGKSIDLQAIRDNVLITDLIDAKPVRDTSTRASYLSPFRNETNASFIVDKVNNRWWDFGTNEGGSVIDFVMKRDDIPFKEAISRLSFLI